MVRALLAAAVLAAVPCAAQDTAQAEAAVETYVEAFAAQDYVAAAGQLDPDELADFVDLLRTLSEMDGAEAFGIDPTQDATEAFASFLGAIAGQAGLGDAFATLDAEVLGSVAEGDSLRHVVVRSRFTLEGAPMSGVQTTTVRWTGARWAVAFDDRMQQFRRLLEAQVPSDDG